MASNKNQHYVPRCYLRPFTLDEAGRAINLFNRDLKRTIQNTPVKNQCSGDYFYGHDDKLDDAIRSIESAYAKTLRNIKESPENLSSVDILILKRFILLQYIRTDSASRKSAEMIHYIHDTHELTENDLNFNETIKSAVQDAMTAYAQSMTMVDDLKIRIVKNKTALPFITSDDPAIFTNRWHLQRLKFSPFAFGIQNSGSLFFLPLTPSLYCILFDGDTYSAPHQNGCIVSNDVKDVFALNEHQYLNCYANVYFKDWPTRNIILTTSNQIDPNRPNEYYKIIHSYEENKTSEGTRYVVTLPTNLPPDKDILIHAQKVYPTPGQWPSFLKLRQDRRAYTNGSGIGYIRRGIINAGFVDGSGFTKVKI